MSILCVRIRLSPFACLHGVPLSAASAPCTVGFTTGVARPRCTCSSEVRYSAAPRNWYLPVEQSCPCARCKISVQRCAESLCLSAAQILRGGCVGCTRKPRSPRNDQWCSDVSQLICGVWRCRLRVRCVPIRSVRWGSLRGFHPASFRV